MKQHHFGLSQRLQDAVLDEVQFSAALVDAGVPISLRARLLALDGDWRLPLIALPEASQAERSDLVRSLVAAAMLVTVADSFVMTIPCSVGGFITYGIGRDGDGGIMASDAVPFDYDAVRAVRWKEEVGDSLRTWLPVPPIDLTDLHLQSLIQHAICAGCPFELQPLDHQANAFNSEAGRA